MPIIIGLAVSFAIFLIIKFLGKFLLWFYALSVLGVLIYLGIVTLFGSSHNKQKISSVADPGFEELTLESLYYAFSDESRFNSSFNGVVNSDAIGKWNKEVRRQWLMVLIFVGSAAVLTLLSLLMPQSSLKRMFSYNAEPMTIEREKMAQTSAFQKAFEYFDYEINTKNLDDETM